MQDEILISDEMLKLIKESPKGTKLELYCPDCGCQLIIREGYDKFVACTGYPKCDAKFGIPTKESDVSYSDINRIAFEEYTAYDRKDINSTMYDRELFSSNWYDSRTAIHCSDDMY